MTSAATRRKGTVAAASLLAPGDDVLEYAVGKASARMTGPAIALVGLVAGLIVLLAVFDHRIVIPGLLPIILLLRFVSPTRGVAVTRGGVVVFELSTWNARPRRILCMLPHWVFAVPADLGMRKRARVLLGSEYVTFLRGDFDRLYAAGAYAAPTPYTAPAWPGASPAPPPAPPCAAPARPAADKARPAEETAGCRAGREAEPAGMVVVVVDPAPPPEIELKTVELVGLSGVPVELPAPVPPAFPLPSAEAVFVPVAGVVPALAAFASNFSICESRLEASLL